MASAAPHDPEPAADPVAQRPRRLGLTLGIATIVLAAAIVALIPELRHAVSLAVHGHIDALRRYIRGLGPGGLALLLGLMFAHALIFYPTEIVTATAGFVYGFLPGLGFVVGGWLASALFAFVLGRVLGRPLLQALLGPRFVRIERTIEAGGKSLLLASRLIPIVPFSLVCYAAGAAHVPAWRFAWTTALGFLPLTAAVAFLGSRAQTLSLSDPVVWMAAALVVVLLTAARLVKVRA